MEDRCGSNLALRKAEETAFRLYLAAGWLESIVGPLGLPLQPSEREFLSCLRNGLFLCNAINKIKPGAVPKVVENYSTALTSEGQPLPAYQYFENVRNFLVAVEELKLPAFEASDLERDTLEFGSTTKIVDCILALKSYHEGKQCGGGSGSWKYARSPIVPRSSGRINSSAAANSGSSDCRRHLDMSFVVSENLPSTGEIGNHNHEESADSLAVVLSEHLFNSKENIDQNLFTSLRHGNLDLVKFFTKITPNYLQEQLCWRSLKKSNGNCWCILQAQEKKLKELKQLWLRTKKESKDLQSQLQSDFMLLGRQVQALCTASLRYHQVVKENINLYNTLQDLKGNIRVYCRIRPVFGTETKTTIDFIGDDGSLIIVDPLRPQKDSHKAFQFNKIFGPTATQEEVFKDTQPLIRSVMDGYNVCIFAYGQTGSGKTHTMCGPSRGQSKDMGINLLALNDLFQISCDRKDVMTFEIRVQMVEIYNEQVRDLLTTDVSATKLEIRNCMSNYGLICPDANVHFVQSTVDVLNLMKLGEANRVVSSTAVNNQSSRSHSVLTVHVQGKDRSGSTLRSCLHLVDLAGSERVDKSEVTGDRLKEAQHINKSLSCLADVITALAQKNSHIPYRNSKLTQLLHDSLGGHAKTLMFAHVSPEVGSYAETISTLKFAQRVSTVGFGAAHLNKESGDVRELKEQIKSLEKKLASKEGENTTQSHKVKELRSPLKKSKLMTECTPPPRPRRLSIESSSARKANQGMKPKFKTEHTPIRLPRLSMEGPKYGQKHLLQIKNAEVSCDQAAWEDKSDDKKQTNAGFENFSSGSSVSAMSELYRHCTPSPISATCQTQIMKTDIRTKIPLDLPKTPEQPTLAKKDVQIFSNKSQPASYANTRSKGSQIRKSFQTIGNLINGSERRKHQQPLEMLSPMNGRSTGDGKSPVITANARVHRRQSLTGFEIFGSNTSRRSSLGGKSNDSCSHETRNARTPPPVNPSAKMTKRRL